MFETLASGEVRRKSDGARFWPDDPTNPDSVAFDQWTALGNVAEAAEDDPTVEPSVTFTPLEFIERFTADEQAAISTAALANADLNLWLAKAMGAQEIVADDPRTVEGMAALVTAGLITEQRKTEILTP